MLVFFFFFQAEDGIRDYKVTGVQTCALPICPRPHRLATGMPCRLPLGEISGVLQSAWASSQITRIARPRRRQWAATALIEPMARLWSPPSISGKIGRAHV